MSFWPSRAEPGGLRGQHRHHPRANGPQDNDPEGDFRVLMLEKRAGESGEILFQGRRVDGMDPAEIARSKISWSWRAGRFSAPLRWKKFKSGTLMRPRTKRKSAGTWNSSCPIFLAAGEKRTGGRNAERGEQQMLVIAMALMTGPSFCSGRALFGTGSAVAEFVMNEVKRINQNLTDHSPGRAERLLSLPISQFVYIIANGRVALKATAERFREKISASTIWGLGLPSGVIGERSVQSEWRKEMLQRGAEGRGAPAGSGVFFVPQEVIFCIAYDYGKIKMAMDLSAFYPIPETGGTIMPTGYKRQNFAGQFNFRADQRRDPPKSFTETYMAVALSSYYL